MIGTPRPTGAVVSVAIPDAASGFPHRDEDVWLPPAWFAPGPRPALPAIMMIGGEFNTPGDWIRIGNAVQIADSYAAAHGGLAPVLVFADAGGTFNNDTECVDGPRGNAASHLTRDVIPFVEQTYGVSRDPRAWGVVGWSMGGTCAVDLAVMHPELIDSFDDIAGDAGPGGRDEAADHRPALRRERGGVGGRRPGDGPGGARPLRRHGRPVRGQLRRGRRVRRGSPASRRAGAAARAAAARWRRAGREPGDRWSRRRGSDRPGAPRGAGALRPGPDAGDRLHRRDTAGTALVAVRVDRVLRRAAVDVGAGGGAGDARAGVTQGPRSAVRGPCPG